MKFLVPFIFTLAALALGVGLVSLIIGIWPTGITWILILLGALGCVGSWIAGRRLAT